MISPSKYCTDKFISAFNMKSVGKENRVLTTGYPRNDFLFKYNETDCKKVKEQLKIPEDKKIILYAPTFRDNRYSATEGFRVNSYIDFDKVRGLLEDEFVILFRAHYFISEKLNVSKYEGFVYDVSEYDDINYLYIISDILITDYSSVFFDYANLKRPIIFYMEDMDEYKNQVRDFYIDINELPGPIVKSHDELIKYIDKMKNNFTIDDKYMKFNNKYNYLDGKDTSKKVLNKIVEN
jgi:CDP-glycerol glycerophosphotransferase